MADKKITQLNPLLEPGVESNDVAAVANVSADQTQKITVRDFVQAGIRLMDTGTIDGDKIEDEGITNDKIAPGAVTGGPGGSIATDTITATNIAPNAIGASELANSSVDVNALQNNSVQGVKMSPTAWNRGLDREDGSSKLASPTRSRWVPCGHHLHRPRLDQCCRCQWRCPLRKPADRD